MHKIVFNNVYRYSSGDVIICTSCQQETNAVLGSHLGVWGVAPAANAFLCINMANPSIFYEAISHKASKFFFSVLAPDWGPEFF